MDGFCQACRRLLQTKPARVACVCTMAVLVHHEVETALKSVTPPYEAVRQHHSIEEASTEPVNPTAMTVTTVTTTTTPPPGGWQAVYPHTTARRSVQQPMNQNFI